MVHCEPMWNPTVDATVIVYPGSDLETSGRIVDDFGEFDAHGVEVNSTHISDPARRWAVLTDDGALVFVDTHQLAAAPGQSE
ncbi:hypothetical protein GCM10007298_36290 [Williamsia phyllosphaerae]|uniref:Uncharacterized protein n=2 Tax=Williamsia phyllosphaerae TaxID=885042 RepID=A0ABQ1V3P9_9NOCA|nr:hypothetical protein GCM10007298_36290 [Williamsia phyllosphaerae]